MSDTLETSHGEDPEAKNRWDGFEVYQKRRESITTPDDQLIKQALREGKDFSDSSYASMLNKIFSDAPNYENDPEYFCKTIEERVKSGFVSLLLERFKDKPVYDIGSGKFGGIAANNYKQYFKVKTEEVFLADPFVDRKIVEEKLGGATSAHVETQDGLTFLKSRETESGNPIVCSLDSLVVPVPDYLRRIAQEMFRVTPKDGVVITSNVDVINDELVGLFPYSIKWGYVRFFSKSPLPTAKECNDLYFTQNLGRFSKEDQEIIEEMYHRVKDPDEDWVLDPAKAQEREVEAEEKMWRNGTD